MRFIEADWSVLQTPLFYLAGSSVPPCQLGAGILAALRPRKFGGSADTTGRVRLDDGAGRNNVFFLAAVRCCGLVVALLCFLLGDRPLSADDAAKLQAPPGFVVTQYADENLAHDIFSMTIDSLGRVVVSGPGYVRILIDADGNGVADTYKQFADGPATGAQGMFFLGRDLLCTGDAGLIRYRDKNEDDRADGPPDVFLKVRTGGEHTAHSIQKGPDGWWYLIVGNDGRVSAAYAALPTSPIRRPRAGTLIRLKPNLSKGEIVSDGTRNAYDFAINSAGDVFLFDSDSEREVSLPWYRPIRVMHALPGTDAGWVSQSWIRPDYDLDMPPVVAAFGRGSPTGVVCYRHTQFPAEYRDALFVLDWTFGRVMCVPLTKNGGTWTSAPKTFLTGKGDFGFAPTDVEVGPDGSLFVSIGGRGTRGGVYRVSYRKNGPPESPAPQDALGRCLAAPQPQSSWSRAAWIPQAKQLGRDAILAAACDPARETAQRVRAIEMLTELFGGVDPAELSRLARDLSAPVRARVAWSAGRSFDRTYPPEGFRPFVADGDAAVSRSALEALWTARLDGPLDSLLPAVVRKLGDADRTVRFAAARLIGRLDEAKVAAVEVTLKPEDAAARLWLAFARCERTEQIHLSALDTALQVFEQAPWPALRLDAVRVVQIALGDCGPGRAGAPMFDGYTSRLDLSASERELDPVRIRVAALFPTNSPEVDFELARVIAMLGPVNSSLLDRVLAKITADSSPVADIHYLTVAAKIPCMRTAAQMQKIAASLVALEPKINRLGLNQDRNWDDRVGEMYAQLVALDADLPGAIVAHKDFGRPGHVLFLSQIGPELLSPAIEKFLRAIRDDPQFKWTNGVVFLLGESPDPGHRAIVRKKYAELPLRGAVLMTLAQKPQESERALFLEGLESPQIEVVGACLGALEKLPADETPAERFALAGALRRLADGKAEFALRERVARLLLRSTHDDFGFVSGTEGYQPQPKVIERVNAWLERTYPEQSARLRALNEDGPGQVHALLAKVNWESGDPARGRKVFEARTCAQCHGGRAALGPDLAGAARRFSREDLFTAIIRPNRDVSSRYRTTMIQTRAGKIYTGMIVYEAVDGLILRNANETVRIKPEEIEERRTLKTSLMPTGLLKDLAPADLADLYAYLRSASGQPVVTGQAGRPN